MARTVEQFVDDTLDRYIATMQKKRGVTPDGVRCMTLAKIGNVPSEDMSDYLQEYRGLQGRRPTRYVVAARGYGVAARWHILARPASDPKVVQENRRHQTRWIAHDMGARFLRDTIHEIEPALRTTVVDALIEQLLPLVRHQLEGIVQHVERVLTNGKSGGTP